MTNPRGLAALAAVAMLGAEVPYGQRPPKAARPKRRGKRFQAKRAKRRMQQASRKANR